MVNYTVTSDNIHIEDSYKISKKAFDSVLNSIQAVYPDCLVFKNRKRNSMKLEWAVHNFLYSLGVLKARTGSVDINWPQKWYVNWAYNIAGVMVWLFVK